MADRRKLIVVSNRGPASYARGPDGERVTRRGGGGLVTALRSLVSHHDVTWIASAMTDEDRAVAAEAGDDAVEERSSVGAAYRLRLLAHPREVYDRYYNVIANPLLWFVQHGLWDLAYAPSIDRGVHRAWEEGYVAVNRAFADAVLAELDREPRATVFFHDYHLYLAPRLVRDERADALLAHFVHIPWPQTDSWHVLPGALRGAIHDGLLANDVVGFHARRWRRNFLRTCQDLAGAGCPADDTVVYDGRTVLVGVHPISVDPLEFAELVRSDEVVAAERSLLEGRPERLVVRVDRTDPSKNVVRGFRAFELLLESRPELRGRVGMLALLDPSRQEIPEYAEYLVEVQRAARRVNDRFRRPGWVPVDLRVEDNFAETVAAYKQFDVLLVNAVADGLNLVAKEGPLVNERDGAVVLSENAGVHEEIRDWVLTVNPFDVAAQADALYAALELPRAERRARLSAIRDHVARNDLPRWADSLLADFDRSAGSQARAAAPSS